MLDPQDEPMDDRVSTLFPVSRVILDIGKERCLARDERAQQQQRLQQASSGGRNFTSLDLDSSRPAHGITVKYMIA